MNWKRLSWIDVVIKEVPDEEVTEQTDEEANKPEEVISDNTILKPYMVEKAATPARGA